MPQYVIEREIPGAGALSEAELREVSLRSVQTLKDLGPQIQWLHSYVTEDKVYCVYIAPMRTSFASTPAGREYRQIVFRRCAASLTLRPRNS